MVARENQLKNSEAVLVHAGSLYAEFLPATGALRDIRFSGQRVWSELVVLVRDDGWQTIPPDIEITSMQHDEVEFKIELRARHYASSCLFTWCASIGGTSDGVVTYEFAGEALAEFKANRIGFCLLHPAVECAGTALRQTRVDGTVIDGSFPRLVEPQIVGQYSIKNLRTLAHEVVADSWAEAEFHGDIFETEDQRNWMDASFKTYCTPLEDPFPVTQSPGDKRSQRVVLQVHQNSTAAASTTAHRLGQPHVADVRSPEVVVPKGWLEGQLAHSAPEIGLTYQPSQPLPDHTREALRAVHLNHLRVDLFLANDQWPDQLRTAQREVRELDAKLEVALHVPSSCRAVTVSIAKVLDEKSVSRVLVFRCGQPATRVGDVDDLRSLLGANCSIGGGSDANFCELNREVSLGNLQCSKLDFVAWSMNPQVHATDDASIRETVHALEAMVATARAFGHDRPLAISPITLKPRFNAVSDDANSEQGYAPAPADPRQHEPMIAAWTVATWLKLAGAGVSATTWYETHGERGLLSDTSAQGLNPVADVFRRVLSSANEVVACRTDALDIVAGLIKYRDGWQLVVVNLAACDRVVSVQEVYGPEFSFNIAPYEVTTHSFQS